MEGVFFIRFNPHCEEESNKYLDQLVECYRIVFGEEPWNEWLKCPVCEKKWGVSENGNGIPRGLRHCGSSLVDFWPSDQVKNDLLHEITQEASCWLAMTREDKKERVVGFCWAYPISVHDLEAKLSLDGVASSIINSHSVQKVNYLDDIGLLREFRGKKLAKAMYHYAMADISQNGHNVCVLRTKTNPPTVAYHWFLKDGFGIVGQYYDEDGRVVLAK